MARANDISGDLFRVIAEYTYDWETWVDADGETRWVNAALGRITGYTVAECLARPDYPLFLALAADRPLLAGVLEDARRGGSGNDAEFRIQHKDGEPRWVAISWQAVRGADGQPLGYRTSVRDIQQRKQMEGELHAIRRRAEALALARAELLANVSHELRSPAHHIAGFAELLAQEPLSPKQRRHVELIGQQARSMLRQVEDLLSLTALEAGGVELERGPLDVVALCQGLIEASAPDALARRLWLIAELPVRERWREGDAQRLGQILRNLLDNALKFTDRGGVCLHAREHELDGQPRLVFEVADTGPGIDPTRVEALLLPFQQGDASSRRRHTGVGLGLAIVRRLARAMGGELSIESRPGRGTRARVELPMAALSAPQAAPAAREQPLGGGSALVIDDSAAARELLCELLQSLGYAARQTASPEQARALVASHAFDVVFLDYQMPGSDGAEVALSLRRALSAQAGNRHVPIYILTANVFVREQLRDARSSVDGILTKPLSRAALRDVLGGLPRAAEVQLAHTAPVASPLLDRQVVEDLRATRARDGRTLLQKLLPQVEHDMRGALAASAEALARSDLPALGHAAHAAAGHAALLGALRARDHARALEDELEQLAQPDGELLRGLLAACEQAFAEALAELAREPGSLDA